MKKIGLLGGTFDPIHFGHLNLAFELMEKKKLDEVWFIPAKLNPHKAEMHPTSIEDRMEMVRLAVQDVPNFVVKDLESQRPIPSYTIDTIRTLIEEKKEKFYLLMGEDSVPGFFNWRLPDEIVKLVPLLIGSRSGVWQYEDSQSDSSVREAIQKGLVQTRLMDISGTDIRERLKKGMCCSHLIPTQVIDYIDKKQLYILLNLT